MWNTLSPFFPLTFPRGTACSARVYYTKCLLANLWECQLYINRMPRQVQSYQALGFVCLVHLPKNAISILRVAPTAPFPLCISVSVSVSIPIQLQLRHFHLHIYSAGKLHAKLYRLCRGIRGLHAKFALASTPSRAEWRGRQGYSGRQWDNAQWYINPIGKLDVSSKLLFLVCF